MKNTIIEKRSLKNKTVSLKRELFRREFHTRDNEKLMRLIDQFPWESVMIIGLGGIGSWVALWYSKFKPVKQMILVDPDVVEDSNINRTPYSMLHLDEHKVIATSEMITSSNPSIEIRAFDTYFNQYFVTGLIDDKKDYIKMFPKNGCCLVIDCRDNFYNDYSLFNDLEKKFGTSFTVLRAAYNGGSVTIDYHPEKSFVLGEGGYETQPSNILPASLSSLMVFLTSLTYEKYTTEEQFGYIANKPLTFDTANTIQYIFDGLMLHRLANSGDKEAKSILGKLKSEKYVVSAPE